MKPLASLVLSLGLVIVLTASAEAAQLPPGSYMQSCRNAYVDNSSGKLKLRAECPDQQGNWRQSGLLLSKCTGDIANQNGKLGCVNQSMNAPGPGTAGPAGGLPSGTWQQSCRDSQLNGTMLTATCLQGSGGSDYSSLDLRTCGGGPVGNQNGQLYCESGPSGGQGSGNAPSGGQAGAPPAGQGSTGSGQGGAGAPAANAGGGLPAGSWQQSCRNGHLSESVLTANCQRRDGAYRYSALDLSSCEGGPVGNENGRLVCEAAATAGGNAAPGNAPAENSAPGNEGDAGAGSPGGLPPGSWQQSCTNARMNGSVLTASCQRGDGGVRFSALDVATCPGGRVGNFEGSLACE